MQDPFDIAADLDTPVSTYLKLHTLRPRFLLESVEGGTHLARYSFLGFGEGLEFRLDKDGIRYGDVVQDFPASQQELLDTLRAALKLTPNLKPEVEGLPFSGGFVGNASYDIVRCFERLENPPLGDEDSDTPLAAYIATESMLVFDHLTHRMALLHSGGEAQREALRDQVRELLAGPLPASPPKASCTEAEASLSKAEYMTAVDDSKRYIEQGDVYQLVLSVRFSGDHELDPFQVYRALRLLNPSPYMYFCDLDDLQIVGSSPEALVKMHKHNASLRPIAGTRPRGEDMAEDLANEASLLADEKENAEHVMLVDLARNDLGRVAEGGSVYVEPYRSIERYSHVMHIVSGVQGKVCKDKDALDLFAATFPAGTLVGAPKVRAMELIDQFEPVRRGVYAGTVGYFANNGDMDQAIAIRTLVFKGSRYSYQAGAGIVADSVPEYEYNEVLAKSAILRKALALAEKGL